MASVGSITVDVGITIPDETLKSCLKILEIWQDENPDRFIVCDRIRTESGFNHQFYVQRRKGVDE